MLRRDEFNTWFDDYKGRWPAVGDYAARQQSPGTLLDTWHQSLASFDLWVLEAVTRAIMAGDLEPVENVKLGTFGNEIRRLGREVLEQQRRQMERTRRPKNDDFSPLQKGSMADMYHACCAVYALLPGADQCAVDAAICLADDHTEFERKRAIEFLEGAGLTWEQVRQKAAQLKQQGGRPLVPVVESEAA